MIGETIDLLNQAGLEVSARDMADILWLAMQIQSTPNSTKRLSEDPQLTPTQSESTSSSNPIKSLPQDSNPVTPSNSPAPSAPLFPGESQSKETKGNQPEKETGLPFQTPAAQALRNPLDIARAFRPLMRKVASATRTELDEEATVTQIAEHDNWLPVLQASSERWLELALVFESSQSTLLWSDTIAEFQKLVENQGAFRNVRTWQLQAQSNSRDDSQIEFSLSPQWSSKNQTTRSRSPKELIDPAGRRIILLISDCISPLWREGEIHQILALWAKNNPTAVLQFLPEKLWNRTALGGGYKVQYSAFSPGVVNSQLVANGLPIWDEVDPEAALKVPVITLEPDAIQEWAKVLSGEGSIRTAGVLFDDRLIDHHRQFFAENQVSTLSPEARVQQFRLSASREASRLAGLMATAPVSLPVVHLIQQTLLPHSTQIHVAEVFMGGLIRSHPSDTFIHSTCDVPRYEFVDGVREALLDSVPIDDVERVLEAVSQFIAKRLNIQIKSFAALLLPREEWGEKNQELIPFAEVTTQVLRRLGSDYAVLADQIEQLRESREESSQLEQEEQSWDDLIAPHREGRDYDIRAQKRESKFAILAIHGGKIEPGTTQIAEQIAGEDHSFYTLEGMKPSGNFDLHIASTQFNESRAIEIVQDAETVVSIHGTSRTGEVIYVGGLDERLGTIVKARLRSHGFEVASQTPPESLKGIKPNNICNRGRSGQGLQLEISSDLRKRVSRLLPPTKGLPVGAMSENLVQTVREALNAYSSAPEMSGFPPLETVEFTIKTIEFDIAPTDDDLMQEQLFEFDTAILEQQRGGIFRRRTTLLAKNRRSQGRCFIQSLPQGEELVMVSIPGGRFRMGSSKNEEGHAANESPQHQVMVPKFYMGKFPITQDQWCVVAALDPVTKSLELNPSHFKGSQLPVERVSWNDAIEFCERLSRETKQLYRLPTEAEWEYACRAGTTTPFAFGDTLSTELANYNGNVIYGKGPKGQYLSKTSTVGSYPANAYGLYDMHGNVWEWCEDHWHRDYNDAPKNGEAWLTKNMDSNRVLRGGSWINFPRFCRSACRINYAPDGRFNEIGFRVVCSAPRTLS